MIFTTMWMLLDFLWFILFDRIFVWLNLLSHILCMILDVMNYCDYVYI